MAELVLTNEGVAVQRFNLKQPVMTIGRHPSNTIFIDEASVSSFHAKLYIQENQNNAVQPFIFIEDLNSTNGTFVDNQKIEKRQLTANAQVTLGFAELRFVSDKNLNISATVQIDLLADMLDNLHNIDTARLSYLFDEQAG